MTAEAPAPTTATELREPHAASAGSDVAGGATDLRSDATVGVAACFVAPGQVGGAEFMLYNLVSGLREASGGDVLVYHRAEHPLRRLTDGCTYLPVEAGNRFLADAKVARRPEPDTLLFPNYFTPPAARGHTVSVIHDVQYRYFPEHFSRRKRLWLAAAHARTVRSADRVVAISSTVRDDLVRIYGKRAERTVVIPNPIDFARFSSPIPEQRRESEHPHLLAVAAHYPHKNLDTLLTGFQRYRAAGGRLRLVLVGTPQRDLVGSAAWRGRLDTDLPGVECLGHVDDATLGTLLRQAEAFVHSSLFEGFGMPVAEALGCAVPTICAPLPALAEVAGELANYCDRPTDPQAWTEWMHRAERGDLRVPTTADANAIRTRFSPVRIARRYLQELVA